MSIAVLADTFEDAVLEARAYQDREALDDATLADIAFSYGVDEAELREALER